MGASRRDYETARDGATVLLGLGGLSLAISIGFLLLSSLGGYGAVGWLAYYLGPATLFLATILFLPGVRLVRRVRKMRVDPE